MHTIHNLEVNCVTRLKFGIKVVNIHSHLKNKTQMVIHVPSKKMVRTQAIGTSRGLHGLVPLLKILS